MNRISKLAIVGLAALVTANCAKTMDSARANGGVLSGLITSSKSPYVVIKQSGGEITDVYKLPSAIIQSEQGSDGWLFVDNESRPIHLGGDMKTIRIPSEKDPLWNCYKEFHMEFSGGKKYHEMGFILPEYCGKK